MSNLSPPAATFSPAVEAALRKLLGDRVSTHLGLREQHGKDESFHTARAPDAVAYPVSTQEVSQIVRLCARTGTALVPFGAGTSLEGHIAAVRGGICLDMTQMNQILEINGDDLDCRVQAGVTRKQLNLGLARHGQFFPVDPGADATLGGMTATRASGTNAVRYGTMKDNVLGLTVVMPDGVIVRTGSRARKSAAGYDLTRLFCGSEGTLGVITEVQLRCHGLPEAHAVGVCNFAHIGAAVQTVIEVIQSGIAVARVELLDGPQMRAINQYSKLAYAEQPTLFFEFRYQRQRGRAKPTGGRTGATQRRLGLCLGDRTGSPEQTVAGPARRLLCRPGLAPRCRWLAHRRLRAHLQAGGLYSRDPAGPGGI